MRGAWLVEAVFSHAAFFFFLLAQNIMSLEELQVTNEAAVKAALADVRADETATNWALLEHEAGKPNVVGLKASGSDGVAGFQAALSANDVSYGLIRVTDKIDGHDIVKIIFVRWLGSVSGVFTARIAPIKSQVEDLMNAHGTIFFDNVDTLDEIAEDVIMNKVADVSGSRSRVTQASASNQDMSRSGNATGAYAGPSDAATKTHIQRTPEAPKGGGAAITIADDIAAAIDAVKSHTDPQDWVVISYAEGNKHVQVHGQGSGGIGELHACLKDDMVGYGLLRVTDQIDATATVKLVFITWIGEYVKPMTKAKVTTHKGTVQALFEPFHESIVASELDEISGEEIAKRVGSMSGSLSKVKIAE